MANFYVTHHKYPENPQYFTINLHKVAGYQPEENPNFFPTVAIGEEFWKLFIYTTGKDSSGNSVGPVVVDVIGSEQTVNDLVETKLELLCGLIDWSQQGEFSPKSDASAPIVFEQYPTPNQANVSITSPVVIRVQEMLPGDGIDPNTVAMKIDGLSINPSVVGNKYDYTFSFRPKPVFFD